MNGPPRIEHVNARFGVRQVRTCAGLAGSEKFRTNFAEVPLFTGRRVAHVVDVCVGACVGGHSALDLRRAGGVVRNLYFPRHACRIRRYMAADPRAWGGFVVRLLHCRIYGHYYCNGDYLCHILRRRPDQEIETGSSRRLDPSIQSRRPATGSPACRPLPWRSPACGWEKES